MRIPYKTADENWEGYKNRNYAAFPNFKYKGFDIKGGVLDKEALILEKNTCLASLAVRMAFLAAGEDLLGGSQEADILPEDVKAVADTVFMDHMEHIFSREPHRYIHFDAVLIEPNTTIPGNRRPGEGYVAARYFQNIVNFALDSEGRIKDVIGGPTTTEERLWLPYGTGEEAFVLPTEGPNTKYGLPQETTTDFTEVLSLFVQSHIGIPQEEMLLESYIFESEFIRTKAKMKEMRSEGEAEYFVDEAGKKLIEGSFQYLEISAFVYQLIPRFMRGYVRGWHTITSETNPEYHRQGMWIRAVHDRPKLMLNKDFNTFPVYEVERFDKT